MSEKCLEKCIEYLLILSIILISGTVFGYMYLNYLWIAQLILAVFYFFLKNKTYSNRKSLIFFFICFVIAGFNGLYISDTAIQQILALLMNLSALFCCSQSITIESFSRKYVNIICILALVSLILYALSQVGIYIGGKIIFANSHTYYVSVSYHVYRSYFGMALIDNASLRNAGPFWEPGAYQAFLNLALMINLFRGKVYDKKNKIKNIILVSSILTTQSATGYILLLIIILYYMFKNKIIQKKGIITGIALIAVILIIFNSGIIKNKLDDSNVSYSGRMSDVNAAIKVLGDKPILGYGFNSKIMIDQLEDYGSKNCSVGLLLFCIMYGIPITLMVLIIITINVHRMLLFEKKDMLSWFYVLTCLITIFWTEHFMVKEIFLMFLFSNIKENQ